eukprot:3857083-Pyramimonas_sp.AAC.1
MAPLSTARPIRLDTKSRVIYNVPYMVPVESEIGHKLLIRNCGVRMRKVTAMFRDPMPEWCLVQAKVERAKLS